MKEILNMPKGFKLLIYSSFSLVVIYNYSNFKGHPADWTSFTFFLGLIQYIILISITGGILYLIMNKHGAIVLIVNNKFKTNNSTSQTLILLFIYLPYLLLTNYLFNYNGKPDLTTNRGKLKWEKEWTRKYDDRVEKRNQGLTPQLPNITELNDSKRKVTNEIIRQLNYAIESSSSTDYDLISTIFDMRIDSLTPKENFETYKNSIEVEIIHYSPGFRDFWGILSFKNNSNNWRDSTRKDLYENTWFISIDNDIISSKALFFTSQYSAKSYCIERQNAKHYSLNNIYLMKIPQHNNFDKDTSPLSPLFWESKPFQKTQWKNITKRNIEIDCASYDSCVIRPHIILKK